jgi:hypothetical protein
MHPTEVATLFAHAPFTWWVVGGWSLEADSRDPRRRHDDFDVAVLAAEVDAVREWLAGFHLWETHDGTLRPVRRGEDEEAQGWFGEALELAEPGHP